VFRERCADGADELAGALRYMGAIRTGMAVPDEPPRRAVIQLPHPKSFGKLDGIRGAACGIRVWTRRAAQSLHENHIGHGCGED
jgi:hypothetical protein